MTSYPNSSNERNFVGYGRHAAALEWPQNCRVAINFCLNYEEGGEFSVPDGFRKRREGLQNLELVNSRDGIWLPNQCLSTGAAAGYGA